MVKHSTSHNIHDIIHKMCGGFTHRLKFSTCHDIPLTLINADKDPHEERLEGERASFA